MIRVCDQLEEALEQTAQKISRWSLLGVLKVPLASTYKKRKIYRIVLILSDSIQQKLILSDIVQQKLILPDYDKMLESIQQKLILPDYD